MTVRRFAERKQWPLAAIEIRLTVTEAEGRITAVGAHMALEGDLDQEQRERLHEVAKTCRVSRALAVPVTLTTT